MGARGSDEEGEGEEEDEVEGDEEEEDEEDEEEEGGTREDDPPSVEEVENLPNGATRHESNSGDSHSSQRASQPRK